MNSASDDYYRISEIQITYKNHVKASQRPTIKQSGDAFAILLQQWEEGTIEYVEQLKLLLLNQANRVLGIVNISTGGITSTVADARVILATALKANACGIILAHNHPSGNLEPSQADKELTSKLREAANWMDLKMLDHLIVTKEGYYSFADMQDYRVSENYLP